MKLYATVSSERATKGQGGNDFLHIEALCGSKKEQMKAGSLYLQSTKEGTLVTFIDHTGKTLLHQTIKGKQQKDDTCSEPYCNELSAVGGKCLEHYQQSI